VRQRDAPDASGTDRARPAGVEEASYRGEHQNRSGSRQSRPAARLARPRVRSGGCGHRGRRDVPHARPPHDRRDLVGVRPELGRTARGQHHDPAQDPDPGDQPFRGRRRRRRGEAQPRPDGLRRALRLGRQLLRSAGNRQHHRPEAPRPGHDGRRPGRRGRLPHDRLEDGWNPPCLGGQQRRSVGGRGDDEPQLALPGDRPGPRQRHLGGRQPHPRRPGRRDDGGRWQEHERPARGRVDLRPGHEPRDRVRRVHRDECLRRLLLQLRAERRRHPFRLGPQSERAARLRRHHAAPHPDAALDAHRRHGRRHSPTMPEGGWPRRRTGGGS
jgi:hypothetical protein